MKGSGKRERERERENVVMAVNYEKTISISCIVH